MDHLVMVDLVRAFHTHMLFKFPACDVIIIEVVSVKLVMMCCSISPRYFLLRSIFGGIILHSRLIMVLFAPFHTRIVLCLPLSEE